MKILNEKITSFSHQDIVEFCKEGYPEGVQIDYKKDVPNDLDKHFAAFSNTRGGVIIIGVEEDRTSGLPRTYIGIPRDAKMVERINQIAANVQPLPSYDLHIADDGNGNVFVLVRIYEGAQTPYYVQNNANIWVRTGNISKPIDIASPDYQEILFGKREKAVLARKNNNITAVSVYHSAMKNAENERLKLIGDEKAEIIKRDGIITTDFKTKYYKEPLGGKSASLCKFVLQPFFPREALKKPSEIKEKALDLRVNLKTYHSFPSNMNFRPIPEGILGFTWGHHDGTFECEQLYSTGLLFKSWDVLSVRDSVLKIYIGGIAANLYAFLKGASNYYRFLDYEGSLVGEITLDNTEGVYFERIVPSGYHGFFFNNEPNILSSHSWNIEIDTSILENEQELHSFFKEKVREIYWSVGYESVSDDVLDAFLKELE